MGECEEAMCKIRDQQKNLKKDSHIAIPASYGTKFIH